MTSDVDTADTSAGSDGDASGGRHPAAPSSSSGSGSAHPATESRALARVWLVDNRSTPLRAVLKRLTLAVAIVFLMVVVVILDRDGYRDATDPTGHVSVLDAAYYATVSLSTTGYGDIAPVTPPARLVNTLLITPLRILFLLVLIGTTLEALTERSRREWQVGRWRKHLHDHVVVIGFGTKGRSAVKVLTGPEGTPADQVVVIDPDPAVVAEANAAGLAGICGDATRKDVLRQAEVQRARAVIVAPNRDDAAVLTVLTVRQLAPDVRIAASVREAENAPLLQSSGADSVITSSEASGRLLGLSTDSPTLVTVVEDLLVAGKGLDMEERQIRMSEIGKAPRELNDLVLGIVRDGKLLHFDDARCSPMQAGDRVVVVKGHRGYGSDGHGRGRHHGASELTDQPGRPGGRHGRDSRDDGQDDAPPERWPNSAQGDDPEAETRS